jgi:hypothetical protein
MKTLPFVVLAASVAVAASAETAAPDRLLVGRAAIIQNLVHAKDSKETRRINLQDVLFFKDQMITSDAAKTVVEFRDGSTLEMGENAVMTIDEMVFNPSDNTNDKSITLVSGTFRFVSGFVSNKSKVEFHTAAATIGIRGCVMAAVVDSDPNHPTIVEMAQGQATVANKFGKVELEKGQNTSVTGTHAPGKPNSVPTVLVAAALSKVNKQLGLTPSSLPLASAKMLTDTAQANATATPTQFRIAANTASPPAAIVPTGGAAVFAELDKAEKLGLLALAPGAAHNDEQKAFEAQLDKAYPNAAQLVSTFDSTNRKANLDNEKRATTLVVNGIAKVAPDQVTQVIAAIGAADPSMVVVAAAAAAKAMPDAAAQIAAAAVMAAPGLASQIASAVSAAAPGASAQVAQASSQASAQAAAAQSAAAAATASIPPALNAAIRSALSSGNTTQLQATLAAMVAADPSKAGDIAAAASQAIAAAISQGVTSNTEIEEAVTTVTVTALVAASPSEAGSVLAAMQSTLPDTLQGVAVAAVQSSLAPAAGGNNNVQQALRNDVSQLTRTFQTLVQQIINTAEIPRRSTASPSS